MNKPGRAPGGAPLQQIAQLIAAGRLDAAGQQLQLILRKTPLNSDALRLLGDVLLLRGQHEAAFDTYQRSLSLRVSFDALLGMAGAAEKLRRFDVAEQGYRSLIRMNPKAGEPYYRLAAVLSQQVDKAEEVIGLLTKSISLDWRVKASYMMIGHVAHKSLKNIDMAYNAFQKALEIDPDYIDALLELAGLYMAYNRIEEAGKLLRKAIELDPTRSDLYQSFSLSLLSLGKHEECHQLLQQAVALSPDQPGVYSAYLFSTNYSDTILTPQQWFDEHLKFNAVVDALAKPLPPFANVPDPQRKLRIGFVSADLRGHSVAYFFQPLLQQLDRQQFEVYCYYNNRRSDDTTEAMQRLADGWRNVATMTDEEMALQIRADAIDLLVDLGVHTGDNRLPVFAWRPAPVQFTWLGYAATSGMRSIDYILSDRYYTPDAAAARYCAEKPALLQGYRVFRASAEMNVPVETLPALRNGYLTFGSFNNFIKISTDVLSLWVELLQQVPDARLVMIVQARESIEYVQDFFAQRGIAPQRVQVHWKLRFDKFLALHNEVDIALDTWPFGGLTTTLHGMWMGVPILTLAGERMLSRSGLSLLAPLGLDRDFVAYSCAEYVQKAQQWSRQIPQLAELRAGLRQRLQQSILMDEPGFARDFESRMRACWSEWCAKQK